jgi:hypothetical protein
MLAKLADVAASAFMKLDHDQLCQRVAALESDLKAVNAKLAAVHSRSEVPSAEDKSIVQ